MATYQITNELDDRFGAGTVPVPGCVYTNKTKAIAIAKHLAKKATLGSGSVRFFVHNVTIDETIAGPFLVRA
jgi:precorrin-6B methylase 2